MLKMLESFVNTYVVGFVVNAVFAIIILVIGFKLVNFFTTRLQKKNSFFSLDRDVAMLLLSCLKFTLKATVIIIAIQVLGIPSATIITIIGSCGLAIGLALQGGLSNLAGGVMIMIFRPFHSKDYISTGSEEGTVEEIGFFYTKLITIDNKCINIPNSILSSTTVTNLSAKKYRGVDIEISVAYGTDIELARKALIACAKQNQLVVNDPAPIVFVSAHADSSINLILRAFTASKNYLQTRAELEEATLKAISNAGIEIPFPQMDIHMK